MYIVLYMHSGHGKITIFGREKIKKKYKNFEKSPKKGAKFVQIKYHHNKLSIPFATTLHSLYQHKSQVSNHISCNSCARLLFIIYPCHLCWYQRPCHIWPQLKHNTHQLKTTYVNYKNHEAASRQRPKQRCA